MNWPLAIEINRKDLATIAADLVVLAGMISGIVVTCLPRWAHRSILDVLRPAEAAARRLVAVLAIGLADMPRSAKAAPGIPIPSGGGEHVPGFALFDPRKRVGPVEKRVAGDGPGIVDLDERRKPAPAPRGPMPEDALDAGRLCRRLLALLDALDDLPRQARRLARMQAKQARPKRAMRPGRPPGHRNRHRHPVDAVLAECHALALLALDDRARDGPIRADFTI